MPASDVGVSAPVVGEESNMDFVPASVSDDHESPSDAEIRSGDEEVLAAAVAEAPISEAPSSPRPRRSRRSRRKRASPSSDSGPLLRWRRLSTVPSCQLLPCLPFCSA